MMVVNVNLKDVYVFYVVYIEFMFLCVDNVYVYMYVLFNSFIFIGLLNFLGGLMNF